jgi:tetratricopeptide (TPR) repeat protein
MNIPTWAVRWFDRIQKWAEKLAVVWADHWALILGSILVIGSVILKWVQSPFSHTLSGLKLSLLRDPGVNPHLTLFSVGAIGLLILLAALIFWRRRPALLGLSASVLIMLWVITPQQLAFRQPSILRRLTYELQITPLLNAFTKNYLVQNYGTPEEVPKRLILYSAWGRFDAAWSFLRLGWYCFGLGSVLLFCYAVSRLPGRRLSSALLLLCLPAGAFLIILIPPAIGQHYYSSGMLAKTRGHNQEAIADLRRAMRWDSWHAQDVDLYATIGQLQRLAGIEFEAPERHIKRAVDLRQQNQYEAAIFEFGLAAEGNSWLAETARKEAAATRVTFGLALYNGGGAGAAVTNWELALRDDPAQIYALPYLTRGYYDIARYQAGIEAGKQLAKLIKDHKYVVANAYSLVADCYAKLGDETQARVYYNLSLAADPIMNYWALTGLVGE